MDYGRAMREPELGEVAFWIMTVLAAGRRHGYAVLQEVQDASGGAVALKATTLYAALERLTRQGLVNADGEQVLDGRARRYFVLTETGGSRLAREVEALDVRTRAARTRLSARPA